MNRELLYAISNSNMDMFPVNSRTKFSNKFPKEFSIDNINDNAIWISVENIIMQNTIIQYKNIGNIPDIIWFTSNFHKTFSMPEICFDSPKSIETYLRSEFLDFFNLLAESNSVYENIERTQYENNTILDIYLKDDIFNLKTSKYCYTLISPKFYEYLGFSVINDVLKEEWYKDQIYYVIGKHGVEKHITADKTFDINLLKPNLIQLVCQNIILNLSGGGSNSVIGSMP